MTPRTVGFLQGMGLMLGFVLLLLAGWALNRRMVRRIAAERQNEPEVDQAEASSSQEVLPSEAWITQQLLPALDGLDDAMVHAEMSAAQSELLVAFVIGLRIVQAQFFKALQAAQVLPINVERGEAFNPELHAAVDVVVDETQEPNTISSTLRRGYRTASGRLLRPASVLVTKRPESVRPSASSSGTVALLAAFALLLCGCLELSSVTGYIFGYRSARKQAEQVDGGSATTTSAPAAGSSAPAAEAEPAPRNIPPQPTSSHRASESGSNDSDSGETAE